MLRVVGALACFEISGDGLAVGIVDAIVYFHLTGQRCYEDLHEKQLELKLQCN